MRKTLPIVSVAVIVALIILGVALFAQTPPTTPQSSAPDESTIEENPPNPFVVPEVPLGTLTIILACLFALLLISQKKSKAKLP